MPRMLAKGLSAAEHSGKHRWRVSGPSSAAMLELLPAAAWAGLVSANSWLFADDGFSRPFLLRSLRSLEGCAALELEGAFGFLVFGSLSGPYSTQCLALDKAGFEEQVGEGIADTVEHVLKQLESLALVFDKRLLLGVTAKPDSLF